MGGSRHLSSRRKARALALQCLYETDAVRHPLELVLERNLAGARASPEEAAFVRNLVEGVWQRRAELDGIIARFAPAWPVSQLPLVDRNILRVAILEILHEEDTPAKVAINEAVELAKRFGSDSSPKFVNGVLGSVLAMAAR